MKVAPLIAIIFAFFLIAIYPIYSENDVNENLTYSDEDNDGITSDKDKCPEENAGNRIPAGNICRKSTSCRNVS